MGTQLMTFSDRVFDYIRNEYGELVFQKVNSTNNRSVVSKLLSSSERQNDDIEHAGNKIVAMLRANV